MNAEKSQFSSCLKLMGGTVQLKIRSAVETLLCTQMLVD
jgi:hypothetical protein